MQEPVELMSPEDGGYPRKPGSVERLDGGRFRVTNLVPDAAERADFLKRSPRGEKPWLAKELDKVYFMLEAVNRDADPQPIELEMEARPDEPYFYVRTPDGRWAREYFEDGTNRIRLTLAPGVTRISAVPCFTYGEYVDYVDSLTDPRVSTSVVDTHEQGRYEVRRIRITEPGGVADKMKLCFARALHCRETSGYFMIQGIIDWLLSGDPAANLANTEWSFYPCPDPKAVHQHYRYDEICSERYDSGRLAEESLLHEIRSESYHVIQLEHMWNNEHHMLDRESYEYYDPFYEPTDKKTFPDEEPDSQLWRDWLAYWPHWFEWGTNIFYHRNSRNWDESHRLKGFAIMNEIYFYGKDSGGDVAANVRRQGMEWARAASQVYMHFQQRENFFSHEHPCGPIDLTGAVLLPRPAHILLESLDPVAGTVQNGRNGNGGEMVIYQKRYEHGLGMKAGEDAVFEIPEGVDSFKAVSAIDDSEPDPDAQAEFRLEFDGSLLWRSGRLRKHQSEMAHVRLPGKGQLKLSMDARAGMPGNWGGARFCMHDPDLA